MTYKEFLIYIKLKGCKKTIFYNFDKIDIYINKNSKEKNKVIVFFHKELEPIFDMKLEKIIELINE